MWVSNHLAAVVCRYTQLRPRFSTAQVDGGFQTTVVLPNNSPVRMVTGKLQPRRPLAVHSSCLEAIKELYKVSLLCGCYRCA